MSAVLAPHLIYTPAREYRQAKPFPHCVQDDFYDPAALYEVLAEWPARLRFKATPTSVKAFFNDHDKLGAATRAVIDRLNSPEFIAELEALTGYKGLMADPQLVGGGLHHIPPQGFLKVHTDFNWHAGLKAVRVLNLLLYLNKDWRQNGDLLLCEDRDEGLVPTRQIAPVFNRCVIFDTTDTAWHGHPAPLTGGVPRKSIALYYYQRAGRPVHCHNTIYRELA